MRTTLALSILCFSLAPVACGSGGSSPSPDAGDAGAADGDAAVHDAGPSGDTGSDAGDSGARKEAGSDGEADASDGGLDDASDADLDDAADGGPPDATSTGCPATPPAAFSACSEAYLFCSWGDDPRFQCRTRRECNNYYLPDGGTGLVWRTGDDDLPEFKCTTPAPTCPKSPLPLSDGGTEGGANPPCDEAQAGLTCGYEGVVFTCAPCPGPTLCLPGKDGGIPYQWFETKVPSNCPEAPPAASLPNWGAPCGDPGVQCSFNGCASSEPHAEPWAAGVYMRCQSDGTWTGLELFDSGVCL